jgi:hypothetical protein
VAPQSSTTEHTARRHAGLHRIETLLATVAHGEAAESARRAGRGGAVLLLPTVAWAEGPPDHPKRAHGLLPYPITWGRPALILIDPGETVHLQWMASGWLRRSEGTMTVSCATDDTSRDPSVSVGAFDVPPRRIDVEPACAGRIDLVLRRHAAAGSAARWTLHEHLRPWLRRALEAAHRAVSAELRVRHCLDGVALDDLLTEIELGSPDRPGLITKAIQRLTDVNRARPNVDVGRYVAATFRRDAELAIRRRIDDPRWVGVALRRFARDHPQLTLDELVTAFNDSGCMAERIGTARAAKALRPVVQPHQVPLPPDTVAVMGVADAAGTDGGTVHDLAEAASARYRSRGGVSGAARDAAGPAVANDTALAALADVVGSRRGLAKLAAMDEANAARWLANRVGPTAASA